MFRKSLIAGMLACNLLLSNVTPSLTSAAETKTAPSATAKAKAKSHDKLPVDFGTHWLRSWEGRWVPIERHRDMPYV